MVWKKENHIATNDNLGRKFKIWKIPPYSALLYLKKHTVMLRIVFCVIFCDISPLCATSLSRLKNWFSVIKLTSKYKPIVCALKNYNLDSREKFKPGLGFEPLTSRPLVSTT